MLLCGTTLFGQQKDWAGFDRYREANRTAKQGAEAVFMGNSITEGWARMRPVFFADNGYIGRGISGQTSAEMLARFRPDVIELAPKAVVILAGTNDIAQNNGPIELENVMDNIASMCELARLHNIRVLLCSVLPAAAFPWREGIEPADSIIRLNAMIEAYARENGIERADVDRICREADFISLHTVLTEETRNLINAERLSVMKKTAILINTARGGLIDEAALLAALQEGRIYGAGLDVFEQEPPADPAWYTLDNLVMGSHCSSSTAGATEQMGHMAVANLLRDLGLR